MRGLRGPILLLAAAGFGMAFGVNMHVAMNVNFLHELLSATSWQQGYLEAIRETMGIASFFVVAAFAGRSEPRVAALMLLFLGTGLAAYFTITDVSGVIFWSLVWSFGFHAWVPLSGSLQLALSRRGREGETLGVLGSVGAAAVLCALACVYVLKAHAGFGMRQLFVLAGIAAALGAVPLVFMPHVRVEHPRPLPFVALFSPRYRLFGLLEMLDGMRKQIILLFAVLALVREHGVRVETIAALMFANQVLMLFLAPLGGRLTDRLGERAGLSLYFGSLIVVFLLYAILTHRYALYAVYMADSALGALRVGLPTYANRIVEARHRTRLLALGVTANHVGAVTLPLVGGALYATLGYRFPFFCGAAVAALSLLMARRVPPRG